MKMLFAKRKQKRRNRETKYKRDRQDTYPNHTNNKCKWITIPIKRQRLLCLGEKQDLTICCLQEINFKYKGTDWLKIKV